MNRRLLWAGGLVAAALTAGWSTSGAIDVIDVQARLRVAEQIVREGRLVVGPPDEFEHYSRFRDAAGPYPSYFGIGQSLFFLPFAAGGWLVERALPAPLGPKVSRGLIALAVFLLMLWLNFVLSATVASALGLGPLGAALAAFVVVFGSSFWQMAKQGQEEVQLSVLALLGFLGFLEWRRTGSNRGLWISAGAMALAGTMRAAAVTYAVGLPGLFCVQLRRSAPRGWSGPTGLWRVLLPFAVAGSGTVLVVGAYNAFKTGSPLSTGYFLQFQRAGAWQGLVGPTIGLDRGLVWYNLWLLPLGVVCWLRRESLRPEIRMALGLSAWLLVSSLAIYCTWFTWAGDHTWGARFEQHALPLLGTALAAGALQDFGFRAPRRAAAATATAVLLAALQVPSLVFVHNLEILQATAEDGPAVPAGTTLTGPRGGQLRMRLANLRAKLQTGHTAGIDTVGIGSAAGRSIARANHSVTESGAARLLAESSRWDFWPWRLGEYARPATIARARAVWVLLVLASVAAWIVLFRRLWDEEAAQQPGPG